MRGSVAPQSKKLKTLSHAQSEAGTLASHGRHDRLGTRYGVPGTETLSENVHSQSWISSLGSLPLPGDEGYAP